MLKKFEELSESFKFADSTGEWKSGYEESITKMWSFQPEPPIKIVSVSGDVEYDESLVKIELSNGDKIQYWMMKDPVKKNIDFAITVNGNAVMSSYKDFKRSSGSLIQNILNVYMSTYNKTRK